MSKVTVRVYHSGYGCDTGCCGHIVEVDKDGKYLGQDFSFTHPYNEDFKTWARKHIEEFILEQYPECLPDIDWDSMEFDGVSDD